MAAKDYHILQGCFKVYLAKKTKSPNAMSSDRREITGNEILAMTEWYLRKELEKIKRENPEASNTITVLDVNGNPVFELTLIDSPSN